MLFKIKKIDPSCIGITPPAIVGDAGYDIYTNETIVIPAKSTASIKTGFAIQLPQGYWFEIMPKSGLATKHNIAVHNGVVDNGYRGEIIVHIFNHNNQAYTFTRNDKVAQGVIRQLIDMELVEVQELDQSQRGSDGFGSTGK